jgi:hypothetical protein
VITVFIGQQQMRSLSPVSSAIQTGSVLALSRFFRDQAVTHSAVMKLVSAASTAAVSELISRPTAATAASPSQKMILAAVSKELLTATNQGPALSAAQQFTTRQRRNQFGNAVTAGRSSAHRNS